MFAPDEQKRVPMLMWFSDSFDNHVENDYDGLKLKQDRPFSHDNLFHTVLGLLEIQASVYDKNMDMIDHQE